MRGTAYRGLGACFATAATVAGLVLAPSAALGQSLKEQLPGGWRLVSIYNEENGVKKDFFGEKPIGLLMFDSSGNVSTFIARSTLPKFAVANRQQGTDKEYREVMQGMIAGFGTYTVEGDTATIKWLASSYPNRSGTTEKRMYKLKGNQLHITNPTAASGGTSYSIYVRAK
jgi:hypothetical protein